MSQNLESNKVARRYAAGLYRALFDNQKALEQLYSFFKEMAFVFSQAQMQTEFEKLSSKNAEKMLQMIEKSMKKAKLNVKEMNQFLQILLMRRRVALFPNIVLAFIQHYQKENEIEVAIVTSAKTLDKAMRSEVETALEKQLNKKIEFGFVEDASVIAGLRIQIGSKMIDMTVSNQLKKIEMAMKEVSNG